MKKLFSIAFIILVLMTSCNLEIKDDVPDISYNNDVEVARTVDLVRWFEFISNPVAPGYKVETIITNESPLSFDVKITFDDYADDNGLIESGSIVYKVSNAFEVDMSGSSTPDKVLYAALGCIVETPDSESLIIVPDEVKTEKFEIFISEIKINLWRVWEYDKTTKSLILTDIPIGFGSGDSLSVNLNYLEGGEYEINGNVVPIEKVIGFAESGSGTQENPYIIETAEQLRILRDLINDGDSTLGSKYFALGNDIDLENKQWIPIANGIIDSTEPVYQNASDYNMTTYFNGHFDGRNHVIKNLRITYTPENDEYISNDEKSFLGLFGVLGGNASISNLIIENVYIQGNSFIGGVAGFIPNSSSTSPIVIDNVHLTGYIMISGKSDIGGLVGRSEKNRGLIITNSSVDGKEGSVITNTDKIASNYTPTSFVGGIIGTAYGNKEFNYNENKITGTLINSCSVSNINISGSVEAVGGVSGHFECGEFSDIALSNVTTCVTKVIDDNNYQGLGAVAGTMMAIINDNTKIKLYNITFDSVHVTYPSPLKLNAKGVIGRFRSVTSEKSETDFIEGLDSLDLSGLVVSSLLN